MVKFRNFTPHGITILAPRGETLYLPSEGCARAHNSASYVGMLEGVKIIEEQLGDPEWPKEYVPREGDALIVSRVFADSVRRSGKKLPDGFHLYCPGTLVRDKNGTIVGCESLVRLV